MVRAVTFVSLLGVLLVGAYLFGAGSRAAGPTSTTAKRAERDGAAAAATVNFQQAATALEQNHALQGTYVGTDLSGYGVALVRADATSYCIQVGAGAQAQHQAGPGSAPSPGPC